MVRRLRYLLCLAFLPVALVVAGPAAPGSAVTTYGDPATSESLNFGPGSTFEPGGGNSTACTVSGYWAVAPGAGPGSPADARTIVAKVNCSTGFNVRSALLGLEARGPSCELSASVGQVDGTGVQSVTFGGTGCGDETVSVVEVCGALAVEWHVGGIGLENGETYEDCATWNLGAPPEAAEATGECPWATVTPPVPGVEERFGTGVTGNQYVDAIPIATTINTGSVATPAGGSWYVYGVGNGYDSTGGYAGKVFVPGGMSTGLVPGGSAGPSIATEFAPVYPLAPLVYMNVSEQYRTGDTGLVTWDLIGVGVAWIYDGAGDPNNNNAFALGNQNTANPVRSLIGKNDPSNCIMYWGQKLYDQAGVTTDDPGGPLPSGPPEDPEPPELPDPEVPGPPGTCDFSFTDPGTWATGGICKLVDLMIRLLGAVGGLAAAVAALPAALWHLIETGLEFLFVPDEDAITDVWESLQEETADSNLGAWYEPVTGVTSGATGAVPLSFSAGGASIAAGSGCAGPAVSWDKFTEAGLPTTINPFQACTGITATIAPWIKLFLFAVIGVGGFFKGLQILLAGLGIEKERPKPFRMATADEMGL